MTQTPPAPPPLSGRRAEAARNDTRILQAAREVFLADPQAPIAAVAERAGVGIGALYRRYESKEVLLQKLCSDGLDAYIAEVEAALADEDEPWAAFARFMQRVVDRGAASLTRRLAGTFIPDRALYEAAARAQRLNEQLVARTHAAGALRDDITVADLGLIYEQLAAVGLGDEARSRGLRKRYLALLLEAMRASPGAEPRPPLPGPPPTDEELERRWAAP